jgi:hypothetical protein
VKLSLKQCCFKKATLLYISCFAINATIKCELIVSSHDVIRRRSPEAYKYSEVSFYQFFLRHFFLTYTSFSCTSFTFKNREINLDEVRKKLSHLAQQNISELDDNIVYSLCEQLEGEIIETCKVPKLSLQNLNDVNLYENDGLQKNQIGDYISPKFDAIDLGIFPKSINDNFEDRDMYPTMAPLSAGGVITGFPPGLFPNNTDRFDSARSIASDHQQQQQQSLNLYQQFWNDTFNLFLSLSSPHCSYEVSFRSIYGKYQF